MLIAGAKGFAKQLLDVVYQLRMEESVVFFDDYDPEIKALFQFSVLKTLTEATSYFEKEGPGFALGVGNPLLRHLMAQKLKSAGGQIACLISPHARLGVYSEIGEGSTILTGSVVENAASLGSGVLLNLNSLVCHDCRVGDFVEISPGAILTGGCEVGDFSFVGSGAVLRPQIKIGRNVVVGAGAVVTRDLEDNVVAFGNPARVVRKREPLRF